VRARPVHREDRARWRDRMQGTWHEILSPAHVACGRVNHGQRFREIIGLYRHSSGLCSPASGFGLTKRAPARGISATNRLCECCSARRHRAAPPNGCQAAYADRRVAWPIRRAPASLPGCRSQSCWVDGGHLSQPRPSPSGYCRDSLPSLGALGLGCAERGSACAEKSILPSSSGRSSLDTLRRRETPACAVGATRHRSPQGRRKTGAEAKKAPASPGLWSANRFGGVRGWGGGGLRRRWRAHPGAPRVESLGSGRFRRRAKQNISAADR
jgi:hypothetical protein